MKRCDWAGSDELYIKYHDTEWGVPQHDDQRLFEMIVLEGAQAGLSWITILKRREGYRKAYDLFDPKKVVNYSATKVDELIKNSEIIRNRRKVEASIKNAQVFLMIQKECGSFDKYIWNFVDRSPIKNSFKTISEIPAVTPLAENISKDLKKRGMSFVGPTICYAFMQSIGMVNDHITLCFRYSEV